MQELLKGSNAPVPTGPLAIRIECSEPVDASAVLLGTDLRVRGDHDFVFYNQPQAAGCRLDVATGTLHLDLGRVEPSVRSVAVLVSLDGTRSRTFGTVAAPPRVTVTSGHAPVAAFTATGLGPESALHVVEIYRRDTGWRVRAVAQGWADGLAGLARSFGVVVDDSPAPPQPSAPAYVPPPAPTYVPPPAPTYAPPPTSTVAAPQPAPTRVLLDKQGESRSLALVKTGKAAKPGVLTFNLNWAQPRFGRGVDLDLGCFVEMQDGDKMVIQPLGRQFGWVTKWPWIKLDRDDRTGQHGSGETLTIHRPDLIRRVLVFAMIYEGTTDFGAVKAQLTMDDPTGGQTLVRLENPSARRSWCAIAMVSGNGLDVKITKEERYFRHHEEADRHYAYGFQWRAGTKRSR